MGLRSIASADMAKIINDDVTGGDDCAITDPSGVSETFTVLSSNIYLTLDPGTGQYLSGQRASVSIRISELIDLGFDGIRGIADADQRPWVVDVEDVNGVLRKFKVVESYPDHTIGLMVVFLEHYEVP